MVDRNEEFGFLLIAQKQLPTFVDILDMFQSVDFVEIFIQANQKD